MTIAFNPIGVSFPTAWIDTLHVCRIAKSAAGKDGICVADRVWNFKSNRQTVGGRRKKKERK